MVRDIGIGVAFRIASNRWLSKRTTMRSDDNERPLPGDARLVDAIGQVTHAITMRATPEQIWPWLLQMGCRRGGWYSWDFLDNGARQSAKDIHPELQSIAVGDVIPATVDGDIGFEVLSIDAPRLFLLGGLFDTKTNTHLDFQSPRPARFWHVTWAFVLEPLDAQRTRLTVRARAVFPRREWLYAGWMRLIHPIMQSTQLRRLAARVEGRTRRDGWRDIGSGLLGAVAIAGGLLTPWKRRRRAVWGMPHGWENVRYPGDDLIARSREGWSHAIEIGASAQEVWPWIAQIGAERGGFYSYQWLENLVGCDVRNAEAIHPEWALTKGDSLLLHPKIPPLRIVQLEQGRYFVAFGDQHEPGKRSRLPAVSWLFYLEPLEAGRCRLISRFRSSGNNGSGFGIVPFFVDTIDFVMDRRMLQGIKERVEWRRQEALADEGVRNRETPRCVREKEIEPQLQPRSAQEMP